MYEPDYFHLLNAQTDHKVAHFIEREPPLRSYVKELEKLRAMSKSVGSLAVHVPMHLFLLDCEDLNQVRFESYFCAVFLERVIRKCTFLNYLLAKGTWEGIEK